MRYAITAVLVLIMTACATQRDLVYGERLTQDQMCSADYRPVHQPARHIFRGALTAGALTHLVTMMTMPGLAAGAAIAGGGIGASEAVYDYRQRQNC